MVKILAVGDFHGKFPLEKIKKFVKDEGIDFVISVGDFFPWSMKDLFFKYCYRTDKNLWDVLGKKEYKKKFLEDLKRGEQKVISKLNELPVPVFTTIGNYDATNINDQYPDDKWKTDWKWAAKDFLSPLLEKYKNIHRIDYGFAQIGEVVLIGGYGHSSTGFVKSGAYKKHRAALGFLFKKFRKENKKGRVIFVIHNPPYDTKLDKIGRGADKAVRRKHLGSKMSRRTINRYLPSLVVCGHMHENQGKDKIDKTTVVNTGALVEGKFSVIDFDEKKGKVRKVKFY